MISLEQKGDMLLVSYYNESGNIMIKRIPIERKDQYIWENCEDDDSLRDSDFKTHDEHPVKKVQKRWLNKYRKLEIMAKLPTSVKEVLHSNNQPNKWFLDIEVASVDGEFANEDEARGDILTVGFCNEHGSTYCLGVKELTDEQKINIEKRINEYFSKLKDEQLKIEYKFHYRYFTSEVSMLKELTQNYMTKMPLITGWNFLKYDFRYLVNRCKRKNVDYKKISPTESFNTMIVKNKYNRNNAFAMEIPNHRGIIDYLEIYDKFDTSQKLKSSSSLDSVSENVLGIKKVSYNGSLMDLYEQDFETYVFYNVVDSILVSLIDKKLKTFNNVLMLSAIGNVQLSDVLFSSLIVENLLLQYYLDKKRIFVKPENNVLDEGKFEGGYVKDPIAGIFNDIMICDHESEYPSTMMLSNMGSDTLIGFTSDKGKTFRTFENQIVEMDLTKHTWVESGQVFTKEYQSSLRTVVGKVFDDRITAKNNTIELKEEIDYLKSLIKNAN